MSEDKICECGKPIFRHGSCKDCYDKVQTLWEKTLPESLPLIPSGKKISEKTSSKSSQT